MYYRKWIGFAFVSCFCSVLAVNIENNAYKDISISFSEGIREQHFDFERLKAILEKSSEFLYQSTRKRSYFGDFIVVMPLSWRGEFCKEFTNDAPRKVDILITDNDASLKTEHSKGCGQEGDIIHMSLDWTKGNAEDLARQFLQQWSVYRYGVFEEDPVDKDSCFKLINGWSPVGCYNLTIEAKATFENGLPVCSLPDDFFDKTNLRSSLMSKSNSSKILDFCDGSDSFPHNPAMPTIHNRLCEGKTVWSVVVNSKDFSYGKNLPLKDERPPSKPVFKCFQGTPLQVTFAIQNSTINEDLSAAMDELGSSLFKFLWSMVPSNSRVNVVMFSDEDDSSKPLELDLTNRNKLSSAILNHIKTFKVIKKPTCLTCGFQKALNATADLHHPSPICILLAWESSLFSETPSQLVKIIQKFPTNTGFHLILVKDTETEALPAALVTSVKLTGGSIHTLPKELVSLASKLQVILPSLMKNPLQVEDQVIVVHEGTYRSVMGNFVDSFSIFETSAKKLMYNMFCNFTRPITPAHSNCTKSTPEISTSFMCGQVFEFNEAQEISNSVSSWKYPFLYEGGTISPNCYSVALLLVTSSSKNSFNLRGWLSDYEINVSRNPLIIYAELTAPTDRIYGIYRVQAEIFGPGMKAAFTLELRDNGNGDPDVKAGDGIFSRYFTSFSKKGTYVVSISAELIRNEENAYLLERNEGEYQTIVQNKTLGSFVITEDKPEVDMLPPNRIGDLRVVAVDHENGTATLQWTAPGDDYDFGKVKKYEILLSEDWKDLEPSMLSKVLTKTSEFNNVIPNLSGKTELGNFNLTLQPKVLIYYTAIYGVDSHKNEGHISNIVQIVLGIPADPKNNVTVEIEASTICVVDVNQELDTPLKYYAIIAGTSGVLLLILILNVIVWVSCFRKYKSKKSQITADELTSDNDIKDKLPENIERDCTIHHSYTNPIMDGYSGVDERNVSQNAMSDPSEMYTKVIKKKRRDNFKIQGISESQVIQENERHSESDLGLV